MRRLKFPLMTATTTATTTATAPKAKVRGTKIAHLVDAVRTGDLTFDEFARRTHDEWLKIACKQFRRYVLPESVELADVVQEMLIAAFLAVNTFDPTRGVTCSSYVVWCACSSATRYMNRQRNAPRPRNSTRSMRAPSRFPMRADCIGIEVDAIAAEEPSHADFVAGTMTLRHHASMRRRTAAVVGAIVDASGDLREAAELLQHDPRVHSAPRVTTARQARAEIRRTLRRIAA